MTGILDEATMTPMALSTSTLNAARVRLRPFDGSDADGLFALHSNAYVLRYWDAPPWTERGRAQRFLTRCRHGSAVPSAGSATFGTAPFGQR